jgi:hydrogenase/urease accessory protein HupE
MATCQKVIPYFLLTSLRSAEYLHLGVEHILFGFDHLLFVFALVILVRGWRRVALTVTAFTVAHSITLVAATLGLINVPGPPVEAAIALSIMLVAVEIVNTVTHSALAVAGRFLLRSVARLRFCRRPG